MIKITKKQADAIFDILVKHAGATDNANDRFAFILHVADDQRPCQEYRFMGKLGWGGKFRNNGNHDNIPYVDCYREHETPEILAAIKTTNETLKNLFVACQQG